MMTAKRWQTKEEKDKKYHTSMGTTDYDIPMFGLRSAFLIAIVMIGSLLIMTLLNAPKLLTGITVGILTGFTVAYSQYFIETKQGFTKKFWLVFGLLSAAVFCMVLFL
jgi:hypothetical protein